MPTLIFDLFLNFDLQVFATVLSYIVVTLTKTKTGYGWKSGFTVLVSIK